MTQPSTAPATGAPIEGDQLGDGGIKALEAERAARRDAEARLKELEPLAAKARELEESQKTETQKLAEQLEAAKADSTTSATGLLRLEVALDKAPDGMDRATVRTLAGRLVGSTREELEADAAALFAQFVGATPPAQQQPPNGVQQTPVPQLLPGALPSTPEASLTDQIAAAEQAGDWAKSKQLKTLQHIALRDKANT